MTQLLLLEQSGHHRASQLLDYIRERKQIFNFDKAEEYRFYLLSETNQIPLAHGPKPRINNSGGWYYKLAELLRGNEFVEVDG
jgi:hypothetical protein